MIMLKRAVAARFPTIYKRIASCRRSFIYYYHKSLHPDEYPKRICKLYKRALRKTLDLSNPRTYTQKMQWAKLYDSDPLKTMLTDKYLVREWVAGKIGETYLIPLLGVWDHFDEIDFDCLPNKFVLKANHGSGWNIIVKDKECFDRYHARKLFSKWLNTNFAYFSFEMHYKDIVPKIIAEQFLDNNGNEPEDFKFLCFDGEVKYCWVDINRFTDHRRNVYDTDWVLQEWRQHTYRNTDNPLPKPKNFNLMIELTKELARGFSHVRVDWYNVQGRVYFGEMTFTNASGFEGIYPHKYDQMLGDLWNLPINKDNG